MLSAFAPAGPEAATVLRLFWIMLAGTVVVWVAVLAIAWHAARRDHAPVRGARWLIVAGGVATPTLVLAVLLAYGLWLMPRVRAAVPADALRVSVSGEQWWWRVHYPGTGLDTANEIHVPVGQPVALSLESPDVIHSFWVPALAGKLDLIPGRRNTLVLQADAPGVFRGACAEFCGASHAQMRLLVVAQAPADFEAWQRRQLAPARGVAHRAGRDAFLRNGCGACHAVRGTPAIGRVGPDLTHVGGRLELAAGALPNEASAFRDWIARPHASKPGALMPGFDTLGDAEVAAIAAWLESLQ
ncbi:MAG TPA: cytochrome c oxidase subunit II [Luteimonas sp.]